MTLGGSRFAASGHPDEQRATRKILGFRHHLPDGDTRDRSRSWKHLPDLLLTEIHERLQVGTRVPSGMVGRARKCRLRVGCPENLRGAA
jgi:hypothetical protein